MGSTAGPGAAEGAQSTLEERITRLEEQVARLNSLLEQRASAEHAIVGQRTVKESSPPPLEVRPAATVPPPPAFAAVEDGGRESSLEDRLGSQWFNRIGIVLLLLGTSWFLKLAIDRGWIVPSPLMRVVFGLLAGSGLVLWSERFRRRGFAPFSYSLKGVGAGVLYLSLWAGFRLYALLPASVALVLMIAVTGWNAFMAWAQDAELLAVYALAGGFATPMLLSTGGNHKIFLFTYLLAIDIATVLLVRLKRWPRLLLGAFPATVAFFAAWSLEWWAAPELSVTSVFVVLFGAVFSSVPLWLVADEQEHGNLIEDILLPVCNAAFTVLAFYFMLQDSGHHGLVAWTVVLYAAAYLALVRLPQSRTARAIHLSIALVLLTIAIPLKVSGRWITTGWLVEGLALAWVTKQTAADENTANAALRWLTAGALALGVGATLMHIVPFGSSSASLWNSDIGTALLALIVLAGAAALAQRASAEGRNAIFWRRLAGAAVVLFNVTAVLTGVREVAAIWPAVNPADTDAALKQELAISAFLMLYGAGLLAVGFWRRSGFLRWQGLGLLVFTIFKTFLYDMRDLSQGYRVASFLALGALLMAVSYAYQRDWLGLRPTDGPPQGTSPRGVER